MFSLADGFPANIQNDPGRQAFEPFPPLGRERIVHLADKVCRHSVQPDPVLASLKWFAQVILPWVIVTGTNHAQAAGFYLLAA